jgi:hypothetical protein
LPKNEALSNSRYHHLVIDQAPIHQHNPLFRLKKGFCSSVFSEILYALRRKLQKQRSLGRQFFAIRCKNRKSTGADDGIFDGFLRQ